MRSTAAGLLLFLAILATAIIGSGCPESPADPPVEPDPPTYTPVTPDELIALKGGTGGGPNMGNVTVAVFDQEDDSRIAGAEVILRHGSTLVTQVQTDAQGVALFPAVTPGSYSFTAVKTNYVNISMVDVNAATVALPMARRAVALSGNITGVSAAGTTLTMDFETKVLDEFENKVTSKYGTVMALASTGPGSNWTYDARLTANVTDTMVISEISNATGKIVNRRSTLVGPYTADQALNVSMPSPAATGLHWVQINASGIRTGATRVVARYVDNLLTYKSYSAIDGGGGSWTIQLQMPPNIAGAQITIDTYTSSNPEDGPSESWRFSYSSLSADNAVASTANTTADMISVSGDFLTPGAAIYLIDARYNDQSHISFGAPLPSSIDYLFRIPRNLAVDVRVIGAINSGSGSIGEIIEHHRQTVGPLSGDSTVDFACTSTSSLTVTTAIPANIVDPGGFGAISGAYPDGKFLGLPYMTAPQIGTSDVTFPMRYQHLTGMTFLLILICQERTDDREQSVYVRGDLTAIQTQIGTTLAADLLDLPRILSPVNTAIVSRDSIYLLWEADADVATEGFMNLKIAEDDGDLVWNVIARGSTLQAQLFRLPTPLSALDLLSGQDYTVSAEASRIIGFNFDEFTLDALPSELNEMVSLVDPLRLAKTAGNTFRVQ